MWIRSQDKTELVKTCRIEIDGNNIFAYAPIPQQGDNWIKIGSYRDVNEALETLNKIQFSIWDDQKIFEMPLIKTTNKEN